MSRRRGGQRLRAAGRSTAKWTRARPRRFWWWLVTVLVGGPVLVTALTWFTLPDVAHLATQNPRTSALIEHRVSVLEEKGVRRRPTLVWRKLDELSPYLPAAVVLSEDATFFSHQGFDWKEVENVIEERLERGHFRRGASTITQQLAKNLFLGEERTLTRKLKEAMLAIKLERALSKRRILTLYLNIAEWGEGVFGAEQGARAHFDLSARELSPAQAAVMAAMLPAPRRVNLSRPSEWLEKRARRILGLLVSTGRLQPLEKAFAERELDQLFLKTSEDAEEPG